MAPSSPSELAGTVFPIRSVYPTESEAVAAERGPVDGDRAATVSHVLARLTNEETLTDALDMWRERMDTWNRRGESVAFFGSAESASVLVTLLDRGSVFDVVIADEVGFLAGSGIPVARLATVREDPPDVVVNGSGEPVDTVRARFDALGLGPRVYLLE